MGTLWIHKFYENELGYRNGEPGKAGRHIELPDSIAAIIYRNVNNEVPVLFEGTARNLGFQARPGKESWLNDLGTIDPDKTLLLPGMFGLFIIEQSHTVLLLIASGEGSYADISTIFEANKHVERRYDAIIENLSFEEPISIDNPASAIDLDVSTKFSQDLSHARLKLSPIIPLRYVAALLTKPFAILTGLSGSGKTKLAEAFALWLSTNPETQICIVAVGADWTNREPLLGYPSALEQGRYVKPENRVLDLLLHAVSEPTQPHFLILDEMNMSHVERYFADFLSAMESADGTIPLHSGNENWGEIPPSIALPKNLFIIGTVNIDETTYMFSPKVLDRAQVIEFRVTNEEMSKFLEQPLKPDMDWLRGRGAAMGEDFVLKAQEPMEPPQDVKVLLLPFFDLLQTAGAEFGYRTAFEVSRFVAICSALSGVTMTRDEIIDAAVMQKLLPKLHGSRNRLEKVLRILGCLCLSDQPSQREVDENPFEKRTGDKTLKDTAPREVRYPVSHQKLMRMYRRVLTDGFTSYAEA